MGKSINFTGQPVVLSQLLKLIDKQEIIDLSRKMDCSHCQFTMHNHAT